MAGGGHRPEDARTGEKSDPDRPQHVEHNYFRHPAQKRTGTAKRPAIAAK